MTVRAEGNQRRKKRVVRAPSKAVAGGRSFFRMQRANVGMMSERPLERSAPTSRV